MNQRGVRRYVADLIRRRRPRPFRATPEDAAELRAAIMLKAADPGSAEPSEAFVEDLRRRLAEPEEASSNRRGIVRTAAIAGVSVALGVAADRAITSSTAKPQQATLNPTDGTWQPVATSDELPDGVVIPFDAGAVVGFVRRDRGEVTAVSGVCTHLGCRLSLDTAADRLNCPCHRTTFAVSGEVVQHQLKAAPPPLPHISTREKAGLVEVFVPPS